MTTYIQQSSTGTHSLVQFKSIVLHVSTSPRNFDIYFGNIYKKILKYIKKIYIFVKGQNLLLLSVSFESSAFTNYVTEMYRNVAPSVCVLYLPLHVVMHLCSGHFICQNLKKCPGHLCYVSLSVRVRACACARYACSMLPFCSSISPSFMYGYFSNL